MSNIDNNRMCISFIVMNRKFLVRLLCAIYYHFPFSKTIAILNNGNASIN